MAKSDKKADKKAEKSSKAAKPSAAPASESSDESSDSSSEEEKPQKAAPQKSVPQKTTPKKTAPTSDSDESSSDDEKPASAPAAKGKGKVESNGSSDASSNDESSSDEDEKDAKAGDVQPSKAPDASTEETKSIFVGRLSWNVDNDWLAQEFASCGEVVSAQVQTDRATGKSRGFGYVHFASADAVAKALEMNGTEIDGRPVNIDKSTPPDKNAVRENRAKSFGDTSSPASSVLFVGNLSFGANEDQLWEVFGEHGDVKSVRVPTDRESGRPKGFAYVEFSVLEAAKTAHEKLQGYELDGRNLRLDFSQPRDSAGGGGGRGGGRGGFGDRGRGGFGDRGRGRGGFNGDRGRGGFGGDRGRGGFGGDRGFRGRGRGGDRGGRGGGRGRGGPRTGAVAPFEGSKITFD
ncbi:RNA-binding domain-containing protein [Rhizopogon vinicolor AM-OR11-026]|uniref:RNA-binding domain-containing protein n=1 Tax=Rhizopogon vinicolor AM-OR11-026 TaxID=1314800 RepID=A0A1B7MWH0_9AGAM|nr:RNA-binding domain-containing protein [Rhizopogon vinicolor AM-OR11-026]